MLISLSVVLGTPSSVCLILILLIAMISFVYKSVALNTAPYDPSPSFSIT